jgi:hypothetical protein
MNTNKIDCHVINSNEPDEWKRQCLDSIETAPIILHEVSGIPGKVGAARHAGFSKGNKPFVSFVDFDDFYNSFAFNALQNCLENNPSVVLAYTNEVYVNEQGHVMCERNLSYSRKKHISYGDHVHGLMLIRRSALSTVLDSIVDVENYSEWFLTLQLSKLGEIRHLPIIGRFWRQHSRQSHLKADPVTVKKIKNLFT